LTRTSTPAPPPCRDLFREPLLYILLILAITAAALAYQVSQPFTVDLTSPTHAAFLEGFEKPEQTPSGPVRWTNGHASVRLPNLWPRQPAKLVLTLSAPRGENAEEQVTAEIDVNGRMYAQIPLGPGPQQYSLDLSPLVMGATGNLFITIDSPTFAPPNDLRTLGVLVGGIRAGPAGAEPAGAEPTGNGLHLPPFETVFSIAALAVTLYLWLRRLAGRPVIAFAAGMVVALAAAIGLLAARPWTTPLSNRLLLLTLGAALLTEVSVWLARRGDDLRVYRAVSALFFVSLAIRLVLAHTPGDHDNFLAFKMMLENVTRNGIAAAYGIDPVIGAYPPLHHYLLAIPGNLYRIFVSPEFDVASMRLNFVMKLPTLTLDLLIAATILVYGLRHGGTRKGLLAAAAYALNPGVIYTTSYNGQLGDPLYSLFVTLGVVGLLAEQSGALTGAGTTLSMLTKPQAVAFGPFFVIAAFRHLPPRELGRAILFGLAAVLIVMLPFIVAGTVGNMLHTVLTTVGHGPRISSYALNIWWLGAWGNAWNVKDTGSLVGPLTYRAAGLILFFVIAYGFVAWRIWVARGPAELSLIAGFVGLCFFMLPTEIHENYLIPTIPLLALATVHNRKAWPLLLVLSTTWFLNMVSIDVTLMRPLAQAWPAVKGLVFPLQVALAVVNITTLLVWAVWLARSATRSASRGGTAPTSTHTPPPATAS
jgi:hypothetical protein